MTLRYLALTITLVTLGAPCIEAACFDNPNNLVPACGFESQSEIDLWSTTSGTPSLSTTIVRSGVGALRIVSYDNGTDHRIVIRTGCIDNPTWEEANLGIFVWLESAAMPVQCYAVPIMYLLFNNCTDIAEAPSSHIITTASAGTWSQVLDIANPTTTFFHSSILTFVCSSQTPFTIILDDAFFGEGLVPVGLQHFTIE